MTVERAPGDARTGPRRWGVLFAAVWLFYLLNPLEVAWSRRDTVAGWVGLVATVAFAAVYLTIFLALRFRRRPGGPFRPFEHRTTAAAALAVEVALAVVICLSLGQIGTATAVYLAVIAVMCLPGWWAWAGVGAILAATYLATLLVPGWEVDRGLLFGTGVAALAIWGLTMAINRNIELLRIREENARLALEEQRNSFARDLHDILGHSLTVITVKAELAQRLLPLDPERAGAELADVERLSRDALADVRRTVTGYRDLTLTGELARARAALRAAGIHADLPASVDAVPTRLRDLFAWTVREGVTNVIRHSHARTCTVTLTADTVEIGDDGSGAPQPDATDGHGLRGLRERAAAVGARVSTESTASGFRLRVVAR
ncbi:histidine kinase [Occultella glacieicola]|uniref:Histidine kinase n=1 Tax=Occultella glacieicola TaxID=2518684 RepID=A0ABY2E4U9_9MICO|nr:histidine kinase [Occultella glacieicola]TDE94921.1 histidine kinase [Occultella glacieicola]